MKKKLIAVLLCSTLLFSFTACGGSDSKPDNAKDNANVSATPEAGSENTDNPDSSEGNNTDNSGDDTVPSKAPDVPSDDEPGSSKDITTTPETTTDPETTTVPGSTTDPGNVNTDSRSLKGLEDHLLKAGVLSGSREEVDPSFLGAIAGVRYPDSHVEIYEFDPNSENFKILNEGEGIPVTGKKLNYYYADSTTDRFVLIALDNADTEDIANAFGIY